MGVRDRAKQAVRFISINIGALAADVGQKLTEKLVAMARGACRQDPNIFCFLNAGAQNLKNLFPLRFITTVAPFDERFFPAFWMIKSLQSCLTKSAASPLTDRMFGIAFDFNRTSFTSFYHDSA